MEKVLASLGIGNATVDTVLPATTIHPGTSVDIEVQVLGGDATQEVDAIRFKLETDLHGAGDEDRDLDLARFTADGFTIDPDTDQRRDVTLEIPYETPVTTAGIEVKLETRLDVPLAVDPEDTDYLTVEPTDRLQAVLDAMEALGFSLRDSEYRTPPGTYEMNGASFVQTFHFRPTGERFRDELTHVELNAAPGPETLTVVVGVDQRGTVNELTSIADERRSVVTIDSTTDRIVQDRLRRGIEEHL